MSLATLDPSEARIADGSFTIDEFCNAERMSRGMLYRAWREGWGPEFYLVGTHRRITQRARLEWQRQREAAANGEIASTKRLRR